jgi:hypothetical protein
MANWFHRFLNPHCADCAAERHETKICSSCEVLQQEVARLRHDNERLLEKIINPTTNTEAPVRTDDEEKKPLSNRLPWRARQQQLEAADREKAQEIRLRATAPKTDVTDLEREMEVVTKEREEKNGA